MGNCAREGNCACSVTGVQNEELGTGIRLVRRILNEIRFHSTRMNLGRNFWGLILYEPCTVRGYTSWSFRRFSVVTLTSEILIFSYHKFQAVGTMKRIFKEIK